MARHPPPGRIAPSFGLTNTLAKGWGRSQVVVNAVAFGLVKTRLTEAPANPEDAANAVYLFCISESDYITGQLVIAGGGLVL